MSRTVNLASATRGMGKLYEQLRWGQSAEHPGLADSLVTANYHMGEMIAGLRSLNEAGLREIRDRSMAGLPYEPPERPASSEETTG